MILLELFPSLMYFFNIFYFYMCVYIIFILYTYSLFLYRYVKDQACYGLFVAICSEPWDNPASTSPGMDREVLRYDLLKYQDYQTVWSFFTQLLAEQSVVVK